jgi:non-heme chloroperoxidase
MLPEMAIRESDQQMNCGSDLGSEFDRFVFLSPYLRYNAPTVRSASPSEKASPENNAWYSVSIKRIIGLSIFDSFGIRRFEGLPVLAFPVPAGIEATTATYSFRLEENFQPRSDYRADIQAIKKPAQVFVGGQDELFLPEKFAEVFDRVRSDIPVTIVPGNGTFRHDYETRTHHCRSQYVSQELVRAPDPLE